MAGMTWLSNDPEGNVDLDDLAVKIRQHRDHLAALMVTYPSTHGVFEEAITEICDMSMRRSGQLTRILALVI